MAKVRIGDSDSEFSTPRPPGCVGLALLTVTVLCV